MKKSKSFIICALLSVILVFLVIGETAVRCAVSFTNEKWCIEIINEKEISSKVRKSLEKNFNEKYNSTGIPADVYMNVLTDEWIDNAVKSYISNGMNYLIGKNDSYKYEPDFTLINTSIEKFFNEYAEKNNYVKDLAFENKIAAAQKNAANIIKNYCDVIKIDKLYSEGVLPQARKFVILINNPIIEITLIISLLLIVGIIILINKKNIELIFYWIGSTMIVSSAIMIIPTAYIKVTRYFDAFIIKQEQIYITFTSIMYKAVNTVFTAAVAFLIIGVMFIIINGVLSLKKNISLKKNK